MSSQDKKLLLGIESSGLTSAVAVGDGKNLLGEIRLNKAHIHSKRMPVMVNQILEHLDLSMQQISAIVLSAGPGSFTGLRIGYSLAKGLAHASGLPIVEVPTLDVWALQTQVRGKIIVPVIDAHRGELFSAKYRLEEETLNRLADFDLATIEEFAKQIDDPVVITGADALKLRDKLLHAGVDPEAIEPQPNAMPESWALLRLGAQRLSAGEISDMAHCEPMYLRAFKGVM